MDPLTETAPAKVNLSLHVRGRRPDGYHDIVSLTAFADIGDIVSLAPGTELELSVEGPFADPVGPNNLVLDAARAFLEVRPGARTGTFHLQKMLPVAAGLGGGSADAAAAIRLLMRANDLALGEPEATAICRRLGADVRVCLEARAALIWGIGEKLVAVAPLPKVPALLVNPRVPLSTPDVYGALGASPLAGTATEPDPVGPFPNAAAMAAYLEPLGNDLETPAMQLAPVIGEVRGALLATPDVLLVRQSGSGPTVFGLFGTEDDARTAAARIAHDHPGWWVRATILS